MIVYQNKFIHILECWNGEEPDASDVDLVRRYQQPQPIDGMICRDFYTILIDLKKNQDALLGAIKRDTRYEIRRAANDDFVYDLWTSEAPIFDEFCDYFDKFASRKNQPALRRDWLSLLASSVSLNFSRVADASGETLVWHVYHRGKNRVTLLHSASLFPEGATSAWRNKVGRANRFQHWRDLLRFKDAGISQYDFGGWYEGKSDQKRLQINKFKEEFGGQIVKNYICERALTWKGALFLRVRQLLLGNAI